MVDDRPEDPVRVVMSVPVARIEPNSTLADVAGKLAAEHVGAVAIMTDDEIEGIVSERDLARAIAAGTACDDVWAADVMTIGPVTVDVDEPIANVATLMLDEGVRHVPVMRDGRVVGIVSERDVLRVLNAAWQWARESGSRRAPGRPASPPSAHPA
jgi:signal-transduction protein with cAMP-binding, CBS, and nucleotidyltransferase domain